MPKARAERALGAVAFALPFVLLLASPRRARANDAVDELLREARAHESAHEELIALRRYNEALQIDPVSGDAYLGLGALRMKLGDAREAERVYALALERIPSLRKALAGRARARWANGRRGEAEQDLETYATLENEPGPWRDLAAWYGEEGRTPAQLAAWRRALAASAQASDARQARVMVRALQILVGLADPATSPSQDDATRRGLAEIARRAEPGVLRR